MTMTNAALAPGSLQNNPYNMYHLQQGFGSTSGSPNPTPGYETVSKGGGKKSWSVRLGLSRQAQNATHTDDAKGWSTISGGSALSRQMVYGEPWLYGTVRSARASHDSRPFLTPPPPPPPGTPLVLVCSCPEFLAGTARKLGNCRKCGGHRLAGLPLGGTCRLPPSSSTRSRPSLAGVLRSSVDDPYDQMRRNRLVEPRTRARSISPSRPPAQRDNRSQSQFSRKERKGSVEAGARSSEWLFDNKEPTVKSRMSYAGSEDWLEDASMEGQCRLTRTIPKKPKNMTSRGDWLEESGRKKSGQPQPQLQLQSKSQSQLQSKSEQQQQQPDWRIDESKSTSATTSVPGDSRRSILECDVNPYLLVKKQNDEDDLSDDLSDNALEQENGRPLSSLFDPSKVKSIERIPNRAAVAAIGGQRIRVFNEPRQISDEDDGPPPVTRIPIPKVSPKRPPRRLKEARQTLKSILKRGKVIEAKRKNVLFNVDNVIFAPEKPSEVTRLSWSRLGRMTNCLPGKDRRSVQDESEDEDHDNVNTEDDRKDMEVRGRQEDESSREDRERYNFITVPNIKDPKAGRIRLKDAQATTSSPETSKVFGVRFNKPRKLLEHSNDLGPEKSRGIESANGQDTSQEKTVEVRKSPLVKQKNGEPLIDRQEASGETEKSKCQPGIVKDEAVSRGEDNSKRSSLTRSQSDRSFSRPEVLAGDVHFLDTMRLSLSKKKELPAGPSFMEDPLREAEARRPETIGIESRIVDDTKERTTLVRSNDPDGGEHFRGMRATSWSPPPGRVKSRRDTERSLKVEDRSLKVEDRSLKVEDRSLKVEDRSLQVEDRSLNVEDRSLKVEDRSFKVEDRSLKVEERDLKVEDRSLKAEDRGLKVDEGRDTSPKVDEGQKLSGPSGSSRVEIASTGERNVCKITVSPRSSPLVHRLKIGPEGGTRRTSIMINGDPGSEATLDDNNKVTISVGGEDSACNPTVISVNTESPPRIKKSTENRTLVILDNYSSNIVVESRKDDTVEDLDQDKSGAKEDDPRSSRDDRPGGSKEALISKLLEESLQKARENGEILDETSGEAILKILKQSLFKGNSESSESTLEPSYSSDTDFVSTNLFLEENPYEVIKEPIYEEIPDEPPPLPLSPPPTEDYLKQRIYFGDLGYYSKVEEPAEFLGSYITSYKKPGDDGYLSKSPDQNITSKFELLSFLMDSNERTTSVEDEEEEEEDEEDEEEEEEDAEGDLEALYEQKETSLGDLSSKSSQISNVSDSSEECNIILTNSSDTAKVRAVDIERTDSGVGSESSQASSSRGVPRRWRTGNVSSSGPGSLLGGVPQVISGDTKLCEDCEQRLDPLITDSGVVYAPFVCRKCSKKRVERKEIITEIVETEQKYGRDLQIILEEFHRPMLRAGLLTSEQLSAIFLNVEELLEHNAVLAEKLKDAVEFAQESGDEDLLTVDVGKIFLESERMLHAFESYCTRQGSASVLLQNLEKEKELLRIFLKVSQMENTVLRRMNLNSFLMVPVQRVTKYPLLLARLLKATPSVRHDIQEAKKRLKQAQTNIELHLEHMNAEAKDVTSTKLWRRISIIQNGRRSTEEQDMVNIKLRKMAVEVLEWAHEEAKFVLEGRLLVAQPTDNNWRRGRTVKLAPVTAMLVANGKPNAIDAEEVTDDSLFPRHIGVKEATLLLVKEKFGRYSLLREPLYLDKCIVCCETDLEDYFEVQELSSKETFIFKAEDGARTKRWCRTLQTHAQSLGAWRKRRGALPNIMICGVARN